MPTLTLLIEADGLLRGRARAKPRPTTLLIGLLVAFGFTYGVVMGAFALNPVQMLYSAAKAPLLLLATFTISLPSFFVLNTLIGLRADFAEAVRALVSAQAGLTVILAALAPITGFCYVSGVGYETAIAINGLMFLVASISAQALLRRSYAPLIRRDGRHRVMLYAWLAVYGFVGVQMGWMLRPFIGKPELPPVFFRGTELGNAYVRLFEVIAKTLGF